MRRIFWGFCRNWFLMSRLHYLSGRSYFGFEFAEIFVFEKRLPLSPIQGVTDSTYHWYAESPTPLITESATPCITDTESRLLNFLKENSLYRWCGESSTPRTSDTVSRRLPVLFSKRDADSVYSWVEELMTPRVSDMGSRYFKEKINLVSIFRTFNG
jgi:hypothetical protein